MQEIIEKALDGEGLLFLGAGFSVGAKNIMNGDYYIGSQLCEALIEQGKIDTKDDDPADLKDLGYISERFLDNNTERDLIGFLKNHYICKSVEEEHRIIADINWKKIYTTNYDDVMEVASRECGKIREPVVAIDRIGDVYNQKNAVIHMNGYIGRLNEEALHSSFKLTTESYQNATIAQSDWSVALRNDIRTAKSVVFIGYSLKYDLELQQIFASNPALKEKCLFVTYKPNKRDRVSMETFGEIYEYGLKEFSKVVQDIASNYTNIEREYELKCLVEVKAPKELAIAIDADDIIKLFVEGAVDERKLYASTRTEYTIERECVKEILDFLERRGRVVILHSDLANGKTITVEQLICRLSSRGHVYRVESIDAMLADDLSHIASGKGMHYVVCENYNQLVDCNEWKLINKLQYSNIKYIFTSRSYIHDNFASRIAQDLALSYQELAIYDLNELEEEDVKKFIHYLTTYNVWGKMEAWKYYRKKCFIEKTCKKEIHNLLIELYESQNVIGKVQEVIDLICKNDLCKEVLLITFICNIISVDIDFDDIEAVIGRKINPLIFNQYKEIKELVLIDNNKLRFKSSSIANHVIASYNFNDDVLRLVNKMVDVFTQNSYIVRYQQILKVLISFSNIRMIFDRNDEDIKNKYIAFYENARKTRYYQQNQFFWMQYAIAVMEIKDYRTAEIYLNNASSYSIEKYSYDSFQVESMRARLLLEKTIYERDKENAFANFKKAHELICANKTPERHYPYRQVSQYMDFYRIFYHSFSRDEKVAFMYMCVEIRDKMNEYLSNKNPYERNTRIKSREIENIRRGVERIIEKMAEDE